MYICVCAYVYLYIHARVYVNVCVYILPPVHIQTSSQVYLQHFRALLSKHCYLCCDIKAPIRAANDNISTSVLGLSLTRVTSV